MFEIKLIFYGLSSMLQFSQFVWPLRYSVWDVFNNFLLIDATDRSKISGDQKRFFIALCLYPLSFFANTPFKCEDKVAFLQKIMLLFAKGKLSIFWYDFPTLLLMQNIWKLTEEKYIWFIQGYPTKHETFVPRNESFRSFTLELDTRERSHTGISHKAWD